MMLPIIDDEIALSMPEILELFSADSTWNEPNLSLDESDCISERFIWLDQSAFEPSLICFDRKHLKLVAVKLIT